MEAGGYAGRLADHLSRHFGPGSVFRDIDTIRRGEDFAQAIESALNACDVVLVVIGNTWPRARGKMADAGWTTPTIGFGSKWRPLCVATSS
jgi:hypothetical protein